MNIEKKRAVLAVIDLKNKNFNNDSLIAECKNLCEANHIEIVAVMTQKTQSLDLKFGFKKGKLVELEQLVEANDLDLVVFANNLKMSQIVNIAEFVHVDVLDRTNLILDIFKNNAVTKEAKLQTEMAYLKYNLQRYLNLDLDIDREAGGMQSRGKGEKVSDLKKRKVYQKISQMKIKLQHLQKQSETTQKKQAATNLKKVALVGYTNAGKSSLLNRLLSNQQKDAKQVLAKDMLFATLDSTCRKISLEHHDILLYDTVGFVSDLPHDLIEAFHSSLEVVKRADLLIEVIDASDENYLLQQQVVDDTLKAIGADGIKLLKVFNKMDKAKSEVLGLQISCLKNRNIDLLKQQIEIELFPFEEVKIIKLAFQDVNKLYQYRNLLVIEELEQDDEGITFKIAGEKAVLNKIKIN